MTTSQFKLLSPVSILPGIGQTTADKLSKLNINLVQDLLLHLPMKYHDKTRITPIKDLVVGSNALIQGVITKVNIVYAKKRMLNIFIEDGTGYLQIRLFHFNSMQTNNLSKNTPIRCFGLVRMNKHKYEIIHPEYVLGDKAKESLPNTLTPFYATTKGISQALMHKAIKHALLAVDSNEFLVDAIPDSFMQENQLMSLSSAIKFLHAPTNDVSIDFLNHGHPAKYRVIFDELLAYQLLLKSTRNKLNQQKSISLQAANASISCFKKKLPFTLTKAQQRVAQEVLQDLSSTTPMMRLLQGDVGSGKTVVAGIAAIAAIESGYQVAIMSPTEVLAKQHYNTFTKWFAGTNIKIGFLASSIASKDKKNTIAAIDSGECQIIIGTHAIFQEKITFAALALMIIDEQHRFGVQQRLSLKNKSNNMDIEPHQLIISATPIPRTLAMGIYADLDISIIDELPSNRKPIKTTIISNVKRDEVINSIDKIIRNRRQVFWVCPLIDDSEVLQCEAANDTARYLKEQLPKISIDLIHGRMSGKEKDEIISKFSNGETAILVATTVIEVGIDIPNAVLMVIDNAERLGLAQLHQLRGRVGRGASESYCILMYQPPLSATATKRLDIMRKTTDGFIIAKEDFAIRGSGDIIGTNQSGIANLRIANLLRDQHILPVINKLAITLLNQYPKQSDIIINRWLSTDEDYTKV